MLFPKRFRKEHHMAFERHFIERHPSNVTSSFRTKTTRGTCAVTLAQSGAVNNHENECASGARMQAGREHAQDEAAERRKMEKQRMVIVVSLMQLHELHEPLYYSGIKIKQDRERSAYPSVPIAPSIAASPCRAAAAPC